MDIGLLGAVGMEEPLLIIASLQITKDSKHVSIKEFPHSWGQNSLIVRFAAQKSKNEDEPVVIIGAHQDSTNQWPFLPAP